MDEKKRILINPDFFKIESTPKRKNTTRRNSKSAAGGGGNSEGVGENTGGGHEKQSASRRKFSASDNLKKQLLRKIRDHQHKEQHQKLGEFSTEKEPVFEDSKSEFENSLQFFENLMNEKKNLQVPSNCPEYAKQIKPEHGCLKGGNLPTYRTWVTQKNYQAMAGGGDIPSQSPQIQFPHETIAPSQTIINNMNSISSTYPSALQTPYTPPTLAISNSSPITVQPEATTVAENRIHRIMQEHEQQKQNLIAAGFENGNPPQVPTKQKKTIKRTFVVGKSKKHPLVSVLVSNKTLRKQAMTNIQNLAAKPMHEIKQELQKRGLIKVGTPTPNHILRKIYENLYMLGGDLVNHNKDTLLHNFISGVNSDT